MSNGSYPTVVLLGTHATVARLDYVRKHMCGLAAAGVSELEACRGLSTGNILCYDALLPERVAGMQRIFRLACAHIARIFDNSPN